MGCDTWPPWPPTSPRNFNPRTHVGCDPWISTIVPYISNFNPRTHVGCDAVVALVLRRSEISIHAPTWGATRHNRLAGIHHTDFNPRTHVGCDEGISAIRLDFGNFNPRTHVGCDKMLLSCFSMLLVFQSTHPRGVRHSHLTIRLTYSNFNPRTHVGCDFFLSSYWPQYTKFQSTHPRGVRRDRIIKEAESVIISIHAPTWGATNLARPVSILDNFNPRTHVGCDKAENALLKAENISIHAPTWGATL